ncbi:biofilm development regulator YmgB/AriR family protein [Enterobacteriaceae bacterium H18W14]|uniref:biofilm development regulator YmgB/AriR family protein n=1 Tax=Dryocola boscaweniae TaxID=2925397 RepID=UPI0022F12971|nr:biofilm development regulator YmgB/AriR family protein [Dryocola boscaweniae]MCT4715119.1 biofilm development regulator YmgB/AriR family protein [Dryocola boscaweniae]
MMLNTVRNVQQEENTILAADFSAADAAWQLGNVVLEILTSGKPLSNKEVIAALVNRLELEDDVLTLDTYRQLLEYVVYQTAGES